MNGSELQFVIFLNDAVNQCSLWVFVVAVFLLCVLYVLHMLMLGCVL